MTDIYSHPAYKEGSESFTLNKGRYINPYSSGTHEYNLFERGWSQALKRNPELYAQEQKRMPFKYQSVPIKIEPDGRKAEDDYRKSKGE